MQKATCKCPNMSGCRNHSHGKAVCLKYSYLLTQCPLSMEFTMTLCFHLTVSHKTRLTGQIIHDHTLFIMFKTFKFSHFFNPQKMYVKWFTLCPTGSHTELDVVITMISYHCVTFSSWPLFFQMTEKLQDMENEAMSKIVELEKQLMQRNKELDSIRVRFRL